MGDDCMAVRSFGLTKHYGKSPALVDLDLEVRRGEVFGYLGPNGAGKTTTIRLLLGFLRPTRGRAEVLGLDAWQHSTEIHRRTGYLPRELLCRPAHWCSLVWSVVGRPPMHPWCCRVIVLLA